MNRYHLLAAISAIAAGSLSAEYYYPTSEYQSTESTGMTPSGSYNVSGYYGDQNGMGNTQYYNHPNMQGGSHPNNNMYYNTMPDSSGSHSMYNSPQAMNYPTTQNTGSMDKAMKMSTDNDKFTTDEDRRLGFQIRQQIAERNPSIDLGRIYLYIDDGTVRLTGQVKNEKERADLSSMIKEIKGIKSLNNKLEVSPNAYGQSRGTLAMETYPGSPMGPSSPTGPGSPSGPVGPNNYSSQSSTSTFPNSTTNWPNTYKGNTSMSGQDTSLADKIRTAISTDTSFSPQAQNIGITVSSNSITLNGTVRTESEKNRIASKVREMSEGRAINNMLEVSPPGSLPR